MSKTPYEIRSDVLALAKDYLDKQMDLNAKIWNKYLEMGQNFPKDTFKISYTLEELKKAATDMISFVNTK